MTATRLSSSEFPSSPLKSYQNPVICGFYPDPSICRVDNDYFLVNSSFEYFPGVPVFQSKDLVNWQNIGYCLTRPSQLPLKKARASGGIFAPTIRFHDGLFYMITTNVTQGGHFYVTATQPAGPWSEPVWLHTFGIDPSLFFDADGKVYFSHNGPDGIYQSLIDIKTGELLTQPRLIWQGTGGSYPEGPHLYQINGTYFLMISEGGTEYGHMLTVARSTSPWGPWESNPRNPILSNRSQQSPIQGTGHADLFQDAQGNWWTVFLAFRPLGYPPAYQLGRETCLAPVTWSADGWPVVNGGQKISLEMAGPLPQEFPYPPADVRDDFAIRTLGLQWNFLRNPHPASYALDEHQGWLRLRGNFVSLDEADSPTWVGRRQEHFNCRAAALINFTPQQEGDEAGLTAYMNPSHHYEIFLKLQNGQRLMQVRRRVGSLSAVVASIPAPEGSLQLEIQAGEDVYRFGYRLSDGTFRLLPGAEGERRYLSTEVAGGFTGVYLAMYAVGNCQADFDWFDYSHSAEKEF